MQRSKAWACEKFPLHVSCAILSSVNKCLPPALGFALFQCDTLFAGQSLPALCSGLLRRNRLFGVQSATKKTSHTQRARSAQSSTRMSKMYGRQHRANALGTATGCGPNPLQKTQLKTQHCRYSCLACSCRLWTARAASRTCTSSICRKPSSPSFCC